MECRSPWKQDDRAISAEKVYLRITKEMERTGEARFCVEFVLNLCMRARAHVYANSSFRISFILLSSFLFYVFLDFRSTRRKRNRPKRATSATRQKRGAWFSRQARATQLNERIFVLPRLRLSYLSASCVSAGHFVRRWLRSNTKKLRPTSEQARRWIPPDESGTLCTCVPTYTVSQFVISAEEKYTERERKREMKIKIDTEKQKRGVKKCTYMDRLFLFFGSGRRRSNLSLPSAPRDFKISLSTIGRSVNVELNDHSYCTILWVSRNCRGGKNDSININNNNR